MRLLKTRTGGKRNTEERIALVENAIKIVNMQDILEFRSDMEESLSWRVNEIVTLKNLLRER